MSAPTDAEIAAVDAGVNDRLAEAAFEPRDPDPIVAGWQDERDRLAYRGDFEAAEALDAVLLFVLSEPEHDEPEAGG